MKAERGLHRAGAACCGMEGAGAGAGGTAEAAAGGTAAAGAAGGGGGGWGTGRRGLLHLLMVVVVVLRRQTGQADMGQATRVRRDTGPSRQGPPEQAATAHLLRDTPETPGLTAALPGCPFFDFGLLSVEVKRRR